VLFPAKELYTLQNNQYFLQKVLLLTQEPSVFQKSRESCLKKLQRAHERDRAMTVARNRTYAKEPYIFEKQP